MPTVEIVLNEEDYARLIFVQEQENKTKPRTKGKTPGEVASAVLMRALHETRILRTFTDLEMTPVYEECPEKCVKCGAEGSYFPLLCKDPRLDNVRKCRECGHEILIKEG